MQMDIIDIRLTFACVCTFLCFVRFFAGEVDSNINHYPALARFALVVNNGLVETNKGRSLSTHVFFFLFFPYLLFLNDFSPFSFLLTVDLHSHVCPSLYRVAACSNTRRHGSTRLILTRNFLSYLSMAGNRPVGL